MRNEWRLALACSAAVAVVFSSSASGQYSGGSGDPNDPWQIADPNDLIAMGQNTQHYGDAFILTADIDMAGMGPQPDGSFTTAVIAPDTDPNTTLLFEGVVFAGTFDGDGHVIRNLVIDDGGAGHDFLGLFGAISNGQVHDLGIEGGHVSGETAVGGLVGANAGDISFCYTSSSVSGTNWASGGLAGTNVGSISSCSATGSVEGEDYVGGLVGENLGTIEDSHATGPVSGNDFVGGLVGYTILQSTISSCHATGDVTGNYSVGGLVGGNLEGAVSSCTASGTVAGQWNVGGLAGHNQDALLSCSATGAVSARIAVGGLAGQNLGVLSSCSATGPVTGALDVGGLVGASSDTVFACYATGPVVGAWELGGLAGLNLGTIASCYATGTVNGLGPGYADEVGGLVGYNKGAISTSYAIGVVVGSTNVGGLVGLDEDTVSSSYFLDTSGPDNGVGQPLPDEAMRQQASFVGFDFLGPGDGDDDLWAILDGWTRPYLSWQRALVGTVPSMDSTLSKKLGNVITLTFSDLIALAAPPLSIVPLAGGDDVAGQFSYSIEPDGVTLTAVENGEVLTNQTWYRVSPAAGFDVEPFEFDVCTLIGDANGDRRVMAADLGVIWSHNGEITDARYDINGDGRVMAADLGVAWSHNGQAVPPKP